MPNNTGLAGGQPQKQVRFAPLYTGRWSSGLWTNRSPLRDAATSRIVEKFYGAAGDALIAGLNTEVSNKLTLVRRPGMSENSANTYTEPDRFYEFRIFNPTTEEIILMIDQVNALYYELGGVKNLLFSKSAGAGQAYMQSVGNILYFGDGVDNKKWLQTLNVWAAGFQWGGPGYPFFTTYLIDPNGNIQQLTGTEFPVTNVNVTGGILTITSSTTLTNILAVDDIVTFPSVMTATFLENQSVTILTVSGSTFTAASSHGSYSGTESVNAVAVDNGTPISGGSMPTWSTVVPSSSNDFQGGITVDGSVQWTNRGNPLENWGIKPPTRVLTPTLGPAFNANWAANTYYSIAGAIIDTNGNLQQVTTAGTSGSSTPSWNVTPGGTTTDGSVTWTLIETAANLVWSANTNYIPPLTITGVAGSIGSSAVYTGVIVGGASNALAGNTYLITGFPDLANNGVFLCTASSNTTLTLSNSSAVAQNATEVGLATQQNTIQYVLGNSAGTNSLFRLTPSSLPTISGNVSAYVYNGPRSGPVGSFTLTFPTTTGSALDSDTSLNSLQFAGAPLGTGATLTWDTVNGAGQTTGTTVPFSGTFTNSYQLIILGSLSFQQAGNYTLTVNHHDGMIWGMGGGATLVSGPNVNPIGQTQTANQGYAIFGGTNAPGLEGGGTYDPTTNTWSGAPVYTDTFVINIPTPGIYPFEFDYSYWFHSGQQFFVTINGNNVPNGAPLSGSVTPSWPGFSTSFAPNYATVQDGALIWSNIGPATDFVWTATKGFTLPSTIITDTNGYLEAPFRSGYTSTVKPTFNTGLNSLTNDNPNLIWINEGLASSLPSGSLSTFNGGWKYGLALVNSLDNTYSNCTNLSAATGNFTGLSSVDLAPADGLPPLASIDPQCDYVAIFRTTDGEATPFLIPGVSTVYTVTLASYIQNGYQDTTPDTGLNNLISGAINGENTPPLKGAKNLTYHLNRIFYSVGNVVYFTTGPATPCGNGLNGTAPANFDSMSSLVSRIVPSAVGAIVFTVSDIFLIQGSGTSNSPIQSAIPFEPGIGLLSYNALDTNGPLIGFFSTDNQFIVFDPSSGVSSAGYPIGDQLRMNTGRAGQSWNPADVYVAWHVQGEDQAWYVADGTNGWYRLMATPAPETGFTWSPFATITGGAGAVQSVEVSPGVHRLLVGSTGTGVNLYRDLTVFSDNGTPYTSYAVLGSAVLAQPGQVATVAFITTDCTKVGSPITLGILVDEALPYYTGPIDILKRWTFDPPTLRKSRSFWSQRFYLSELENDAAAMRHMQVQINFSPNDIVQNELQTLTIFGAYQQEI